VRTIRHRGRDVRTGIWKLPAEGPVEVGPLGLVDDVQVDRRYHGGTDKAVYAYAVEDGEWWREEEGVAWEPGLFGENLTVSGLDLVNAPVGQRWRVGSTLLEVSEPRTPCFKLGHRIGDMRFVRRFAKALRLGAYLRVIEPGHLAAGNPVAIVEAGAGGETMVGLGRARLGG
jgi:MOSC domain-containing protein YiiM